MSLSNNFPTIKPSLMLDFANTEALDPRITFTRTTTATYYNGVTTAKAEENLFLQSQTLNTGWLTLNVTVTADNATAPDGTTTADTIVENAATGVHEIYSFATVNGVTYTISVFAKRNSGTRNLTFRGAGQGGAGVHPIFDLGSGTVAQNGTGTWSNQTIVSVGGGWYRCSATVVASAVANMFIGMADGTSQSYTGDDTSSIDLWGAQLEQRSAVTAYTPTTTQPITNYIPVLQTAASGVARFDHNPTTGESLGLLIEEQRTNLRLRSEEFDNAEWVKQRTSVVSNTIIAPSGALTGDKLVENTDNNTHFVTGLTSFTTASASLTLSVYAKKAERNIFWLQGSQAAQWSAVPSAFFNLETGVVSGATNTTQTSITPVGNGWYRCSISGTTASSGVTTPGINIYLVSTGTTTSYTGNGYDGIYLWGAQLEAGAFPTSYIPTVAATVTRNADVASMTGTNFSSWYRADEGAVYAEWNSVGSLSGGSNLAYAISDGTFNNTHFINASVSGAANQTQAAFRSGGSAQAVISIIGAYTNYAYRKTAAAYEVDNFAVSGDGSSAFTDTSGIVMSGIDRLFFGASWTGSDNVLNGTIKKLAFYPSRLTDAQLQALTT